MASAEDLERITELLSEVLASIGYAKRRPRARNARKCGAWCNG